MTRFGEDRSHCRATISPKQLPITELDMLRAKTDSAAAKVVLCADRVGADGGRGRSTRTPIGRRLQQSSSQRGCAQPTRYANLCYGRARWGMRCLIVDD